MSAPVLNALDPMFGNGGSAGFFAEYWGRTFGRFPGNPDRFLGLISWEELDDILDRQTIDTSRCRLFRGGKPVDTALYALEHRGVKRIKPASFVNCLDAGATLIFDSIEEHAPRVRELARSFEAVLGSLVSVNLYAAWRTEQGFELHWDRQDTCILQVSGSKRWQVFEPTRLHPLKDDLEPPPKPTRPPVWEGVLQQGEMLYLPKGWWHVVTALDQPSLHLTITVVPPTGADLLAWGVGRLKQHPLIRQNLPMPSTGAERSKHWGALRDLVAAEWTDALFEEFMAEWRSTVFPSAWLGLPMSPARVRTGIKPGTLLRLATSCRLELLGARDGSIGFHANGSKWECSAHFTRALEELRGDAEVEFDWLCSHVAEPERARFASFLGVLQIGGVLWTRNPGDA